jgi:hypothetical protein
MADLMTTQEKARKKKEAERKEELDAFNGSGNLGHDASRARADMAKDTKKSQELAAKDYREKAMDYARADMAKQTKKSHCRGRAVDHARKRKPEKKGAVTPSRKTNVKQKNPAPKAKTQGERKVPVASDAHGCRHSGLLELLPIDRKYLQAFVKEGGWLYKTPCLDCAKDEGGDKRVLDVSDLLKVKGRGELGVCCNCGPVGHNMIQEEEPLWKQQWTCKMVLCMDCLSKRKKGMAGINSRGATRSRKQKNLDW